MYTKQRYSSRDVFLWTRREIFIFLFVALIPLLLYEVAGLTWLRLPWTPIALIGTAVAFLIGFQNNAAYGRAWEARKIWGGIVNESRSWGIFVQDMVTDELDSSTSDEEVRKHRTKLIHRHIAWMAALRHSMRQPRPWETSHSRKTDREWHEQINIPERERTLEEDLAELLDESELREVLTKTNKSTALLTLQSKHLRELKESHLLWDFSFLEMESHLRVLFELQGKSERIKNFPYPRQYTTLCFELVRMFVLMLPFGIIPEFAKTGEALSETFPLIGQYFVWLAVPFTAIVAWVFHTMQRIGISGENPFEGSANDVPISTIARGIEIDLREMNQEPASAIPEPIEARLGVQM